MSYDFDMQADYSIRDTNVTQPSGAETVSYTHLTLPTIYSV